MQPSQPVHRGHQRPGGGGPGHGHGAELRHRRRRTVLGQGWNLLRLSTGPTPGANLAARGPRLELHRHQGPDPARRNALLGRVRIGGGSAAEQAVFYTALYHSLLYPSVFSDDNRQYLGVDGRVHTVDPGHAAFYTNFSGWDIYRAQAQLEALVDPDAASDAAQSMLDDYAQGGALPKWMQNNVETYFMVGDPADAVLADYYAFGARHFDAGIALADMIAEESDHAWSDRPGLSERPGAARFRAGSAVRTAAATTTSRSPPRWSTTPMTSRSRPWPGRSASAPRRRSSWTGRRDWRNVLNLGQPLRPAAAPWTGAGSPASSRAARPGSSRPTRWSTPAWCRSTWPA